MDVPDTQETEKVLGPLPDGQAEEPERFPGGADSVADQEKYGDIPQEPLTPDVPPADNPAAADAPEGVTEGDDKPQAPEGDGSGAHDREAGSTDDSSDRLAQQPGEAPAEPAS